MSWFAASFLVVVTCCTSGLPQDESTEATVYFFIPLRTPRKESDTIETTVSRPNAYHPLVRFRTIEVRPAYFYVLKNSPETEEQKVTAGELAQLLSSFYMEEYNEPPPRESSQNIIRFGLIR